MNGKLNEAQLELLKSMSNMDEAEFLEFKTYILKFKTRKLRAHLDKVFDEKGINPDDLLSERFRTPYTHK